MGTFIYYTLMKFFRVVLGIVAPFNTKANKWVKGRKGLFQDIKLKLENEQNPKVWIHCSSLGEFEQARPVIEAFREKHPEFKIILTFFSPSGYEIRKDYKGADWVFYLPLDTPYNAKRLVKLFSPDLVFFVKYDFWYFILRQLYREKIPVILFSAIFRDNQLFFKKIFGWYRRLLFFFDHIFVQDDYSKKLLESIGYYAVSVAGDTRFDRVVKIASKNKTSDRVDKFKAGTLTIVAGSTWQQDEILLSEYLKHNRQIKAIIAPHNVEEKNIAKLTELFNSDLIKCSVLEQDENSLGEKHKVLLIDSIGRLYYLYKYADIAYVGGGFGAGIHNILEAAVYGKPVIFGPNYQKFKEARELIKLGGAFSIGNQEELFEILDKLVKDSDFRKEAGEIAKNYVLSNTGATEKILSLVESKLIQKQ